MNHYFNEAGEPLMTHAQARLEAELDEQCQEDDRLQRYHEDDGYDAEEEDEDCDDDAPINEDMGYFGYMGMMED